MTSVMIEYDAHHIYSESIDISHFYFTNRFSISRKSQYSSDNVLIVLEEFQILITAKTIKPISRQFKIDELELKEAP